MEHISEILRRQTQANISNKNTGTWSSAEEAGSVCPICQGIGFIYANVPVGHPDFGRAVPCRCAKEKFDKEYLSRLQRYSNLGALTRLTFDKLSPQGRGDSSVSQEQFNRACQAAKTFAAGPEGWLVLAGASGCGKTHLAAAIANECIKNNHPVFYITAPDLLDHLRSSFSPDSEIPYDELFDQVRNTPLLVLDDLGAQSSTRWAKEKLEQLLNHRFNHQLPTVIVSIVPIDELEERIRTRLIASDFCQVCVVREEPLALSTTSWATWFELQKSMTFDNFDSRRVNLSPEEHQNLEAAYRLALDYARSPEGWVVFQGVIGCGKTHLAAAIVNYRYQVKKPALFIVVPDLLDHLRSTFSPESKSTYDQLFESVKSTPLLVLDDLGQQTTTPWAQEKLYQIINHRYNARLPMVVTTTCSTDEIDSPISSRFVDPKISLIFHIMAPDFRTDAPSSPKKIPRGGRRGS